MLIDAKCYRSVLLAIVVCVPSRRLLGACWKPARLFHSSRHRSAYILSGPFWRLVSLRAISRALGYEALCAVVPPRYYRQQRAQSTTHTSGLLEL